VNTAARRRLALLAVTLVALMAGCDWPMFHYGPEGARFNPETTISVGNARRLTGLWSAAIPAVGLGTPPIEGANTVVFGNRAFDAKTGRLRWATPDGYAIAIVGNIVFQTVYRQVDGAETFRALDVTTGAVQWSWNLSEHPVMVANGLVFATGGGTHGGSAYIATFDARTGARRGGVGYYDYSGPTVSNGLVYVIYSIPYSNDFNLYLWAYDEHTGALRWKAVVPKCGASYRGTNPIVANGKVYADGHTFDAASGRLLFDWPVCPNVGYGDPSPSVSRHLAFVPYLSPQSEPRLAAFDARTGTLKWSIPWIAAPGSGSQPKSVPGSAPAIANGVLFGLDVNVPGSSSGGNHVIAVDAATGARLWDSPRDPSNLYGEPIIANGVVYAQSENGHLDAFHVPGT
jgi:outer membrane protein assembly factor BamB